MRIRIAAAMTALALLLFPLGALMIVHQGFSLTMERERTRALSEEAAIARAVALEVSAGDMESLYAVASGLQRRYGSESLSVMLLYRCAPMAGAQPGDAPELDELIRTPGRATLLDGQSETLFIAHQLGTDLTLLLASDVSAVYDFRRELALWAGALSACGVMLSGLMSVVISGWLSRPFRLLAQQRQELIDALAHEMRTPLTAIVAGSRLLQHAHMGEEQRIELLDTMAREARRLSQMDERLLLLTRMEHEKPAFTHFSSREMAQEALSVFEGVQLSGDDAQFIAERELTIQLLRNLVVNALRAGGESPVQVTLLPDGFTVRDRGCGMTREQIERAFEPFYRADKSRSRTAGGAGLGLTICRRIAQLHGGRLSIDSAPGEGTTVVYHFDTNL